MFPEQKINKHFFTLGELVKSVKLLMRTLFIFSVTFLDPKLDFLVTVLERLVVHTLKRLFRILARLLVCSNTISKPTLRF